MENIETSYLTWVVKQCTSKLKIKAYKVLCTTNIPVYWWNILEKNPLFLFSFLAIQIHIILPIMVIWFNVTQNNVDNTLYCFKINEIFQQLIVNIYFRFWWLSQKLSLTWIYYIQILYVDSLLCRPPFLCCCSFLGTVIMCAQ